MRKIGLILAVFFFVSAINTVNVSAQELMSLEEVEKLLDSSPSKTLKAHFESVPKGAGIRHYDINIRGIVREPGLKIIVFTTTHKIVAGMSGSPVYVDDKLIGATAYQLNSPGPSDYSWGGISSISLMMEESRSGQQRLGAARSFSYQGMDFVPIATGYQQIPGLESLASNKFIITTSRSGSFDSAGKRSQLKAGRASLKAGMPIVVDLIEWTDEKGEITTVGAMGTVTYIGGDGRIFAFGHPFLNSQNVVYSFRTAEVLGTVFQDQSFKLSWKKSDILGAITFDSAYGIYGTISPDELNKLHRFNLEFKTEGKPLHNFDIKVADSILTPLLAQAAFAMIGQIYGAPLPQEMSVTQLEARVELEGHNPIVWKELFSSESNKFGPAIIYTSSYSAAHETFFEGIYGSLYVNNYGIRISDISVSVNFISGRSQVFKLADSKFPHKVVYGENPVLEVLFTDRDNLMSIAKKVPVRIDWDQVEKPVYTRDTLDTDKASEKIVRGSISISSAMVFFNSLSNNEKQKLRPGYFLGAEDFLENFSRQLEAGNQKIFVRVTVKSRSGLFDDKIVKTEDVIPADVTDNTEAEWYVIKGGLKERKTTVKNEGRVIFYLDLPQVPDGYIIDQSVGELLFFEVVLDK